jgi:hypothetical protein
MADGTRLFQLSESLKECQDAIFQQQNTTNAFQQQQHSHNTAFQQQLIEVSDMLLTLVTTQARPPPERPPLGDQGVFPLPVIPGREDQRVHGRDRDDREFIPNPGWHHQDNRRAQFDGDNHDHYQRDRFMQPRPLRLDFPRFDGENPDGWTYKVNQFFDYYQTPFH